MNFDEFCKGSFTKWDGEPPEGVKTWDRERGRFVDPFTMKSEARKFTEQMDAYVEFMNNGRLRGDISSGYTYGPKIYGRRADAKSTTHTYDILKELLKNTTLPDTRDTYKMANIINEGENTMPVNYNEFFTTGRVYMTNVFLPKIKDVIFNPPATIVLWDDNSKTVVKAQNGEPYDPEKGLAMCIVKKVYGNRGKYFNNISKWVEKYWAKKEAEEEAKYREMLREEEDEFELCVVKSEQKAEKVLSRMRELVREQGYVTVSQYYELCGRKYTAWGTKIGWNKLRGVKIYKVVDGYKVWLPKTNWTKE